MTGRYTRMDLTDKQQESIDEAKFWAHVDLDLATGCWNWRGSMDYRYGCLYLAGRRTISAHRFAYALLVGDIPEGLHIDHLCRNTKCVNPAHLQPVTCRENLHRAHRSWAAINKGKTYCSNGHLLAGNNLYLWANGKGGEHRQCRTCKVEWNRQYRAAKKVA